MGLSRVTIELVQCTLTYNLAPGTSMMLIVSSFGAGASPCTLCQLGETVCCRHLSRAVVETGARCWQVDVQPKADSISVTPETAEAGKRQLYSSFQQT